MSEQRRGNDAAGADTTELDASVQQRWTPSTAERVYLVVRLDDGPRILELGVGEQITFGRTNEAHVVLDDPKVSRHHATVRRTGSATVLTDHGSRNGTLVCGEHLQGAERVLAGGDVLMLGRTEVVVASTTRAAVPAHAAEPADRLVVADPSMCKLYDLVRKLAAAPTTVLVLGETGSGKEIVAEHLHSWSARADRPFVRLSCASLPETLLESELFGYEKGAFTGAERRKIGFFEAAQGGTLMLDEVGELTASMQAKLLRVLESRKLTRIGGVRDVDLDVRVVCATHRDLKSEVAKGSFREDLFYRISAFTITVPPLRERPTEILLLAQLFAEEAARSMGRPAPPIEADACVALSSHAWPGNVRELRNVMEHAVIVADGAPIVAAHLPEGLREPSALLMRGRYEGHERANIEAALAANDGNQTRAAKQLGISRRTLLYKMAKYDLKKKR